MKLKAWKKLKNKTVRTVLGRSYMFFRVKDKETGKIKIVDVWNPIKGSWTFLDR